MKIAVRYYTRSGNTKKLADAIAAAVGTEAKSITEGLTEDVDILFLGSSVYGGSPDANVKAFIDGLNVNVGKVVNFSTAALVRSTYKSVKKMLDAKGIKMAEEDFACKGSFKFMHRGKPNAADCEAAAEFAKKVIG